MLSVDDLKPPRAQSVDQDKGSFRPLGPTSFLLGLGWMADQNALSQPRPISTCRKKSETDVEALWITRRAREKSLQWERDCYDIEAINNNRIRALSWNGSLNSSRFPLDPSDMELGLRLSPSPTNSRASKPGRFFGSNAISAAFLWVHTAGTMGSEHSAPNGNISPLTRLPRE